MSKLKYYSPKEKRMMAKHLIEALDDADVSMVTIPRKEGYPELALIKKEIFMDLAGGSDMMKKWIFLACQGIVALDASKKKADMALDIEGLMRMAADAGRNFLGMDEDFKTETGEEQPALMGASDPKPEMELQGVAK